MPFIQQQSSALQPRPLQFIVRISKPCVVSNYVMHMAAYNYFVRPSRPLSVHGSRSSAEYRRRLYVKKTTGFLVRSNAQFPTLTILLRFCSNQLVFVAHECATPTPTKLPSCQRQFNEQFICRSRCTAVSTVECAYSSALPCCLSSAANQYLFDCKVNTPAWRVLLAVNFSHHKT